MKEQTRSSGPMSEKRFEEAVRQLLATRPQHKPAKKPTQPKRKKRIR